MESHKSHIAFVATLVALIAVTLTALTISTHTDKNSIGMAAQDLEPPTATDPQPHRADALLLKFKPGVPDHAKQGIYSRFGLRERSAIGEVRVVSVPPQALERVQQALAHNPAVEFAEKDYLRKADLMPNDPLLSSEYHVYLMRYPQAWNLSPSTAEVLVAAPDTGIDVNHPDLTPILRMDLAYNSVDHSANVTTVYPHGTGTVGSLAAATDNGVGIATAPWTARIIPIRVTNSADGYAYDSSIANAITYAASNGAKVVSVSYQVGESSTVRSAAATLRSKGGLLFTSAGNYNSQTYTDLPEIIVVAATDSADNRASFSNYGAAIDLAAPGVGVYTLHEGGAYGGRSGTSFASPVAASVAAYLFSVYPNAPAAQVEQALYVGAKDLGTPGRDANFGYGRVDALGALQAMDQTGDRLPPAVAITAPPTAVILVCPTTVAVSATDNYGIEKTELYVDGSLLGTATTGQNGVYSFYWDVLTAAEGTHGLIAKAYDTSGNTAISANRTITVVKSNHTPTIQITQPAAGTSVSGTVTVSTSASESTDEVAFYLNGALQAMDYDAPYTWSLNTKPYAGQPLTIRAVATSCTGLSSESAVNVTVSGGKGGGRRK